MIEHCLDNIIGLSNRNCNCTDTDKPSTANESLSGLFVDDMFEGANILKLGASLSCEDELWTVLENAKTKAIKQFPTDLMMLVRKNGRNLVDYTGVLGNPEKATKLVTGIATGSQVGMNFKGYGNKIGTTVTINFIGLKLDTSAAVDVHLYRSDNMNTALHTWTINTNSGSESYSNERYSFNLFSNTGISYEYYLLYSPVGMPYETKLFCCGDRGTTWAKHTDSYGIVYNNGTVSKNQKVIYGLLAGITISCNDEWLCSNWDYGNDPWADPMAKTIQLMAIKNVYSYILNSNKVNQWTLLNEPEHMFGKLKHLDKEIAYRLVYLSEELPKQAENCWTCNSSINMGSIIV